MNIQQRIASIDITRAVTMLLMIFVNDLWTLRNIPSWLGHTAQKTMVWAWPIPYSPPSSS